jgi:hypothetical protein
MYHKHIKRLQKLLKEKSDDDKDVIITEFYNKNIGKIFKLSYFFTKFALKYIEIGQKPGQKTNIISSEYFLLNEFRFLGYRIGGKNDDDIYDQNTEWFMFENDYVSFTFRIFYLQSTIVSIFYSVKNDRKNKN